MSLRLFRRGHGDVATSGRHARQDGGPFVPGAAATLMAGSYVEPTEPRRAPATAAQPAPDAAQPVLVAAPTDLPVERGADPGVATAPVPDAPPVPVAAERSAGGPVTLGFADGAQVDLHPDDPRVRTFRAAAAALLEPPG